MGKTVSFARLSEATLKKYEQLEKEGNLTDTQRQKLERHYMLPAVAEAIARQAKTYEVLLDKDRRRVACPIISALAGLESGHGWLSGVFPAELWEVNFSQCQNMKRYRLNREELEMLVAKWLAQEAGAREHMIPQEVIEAHWKEHYVAGYNVRRVTGKRKTIPRRRYSDFAEAQQWHVGPEQREWIVLTTDGFYRAAYKGEM